MSEFHIGLFVIGGLAVVAATALLAGCTLIDTSTNYMDGESERLVGSVLAQLDRAPGHDASHGDWQTARRYYVTRAPERSQLLADLGEPLTYTLVVSNAGPSDVTGATVTVTLDVFCIDSHRASPQADQPFALARKRLPSDLRQQITDRAGAVRPANAPRSMRWSTGAASHRPRGAVCASRPSPSRRGA